MPCRCPTNALRLFIRSLIQEELPCSTLRSSRLQWRNATIRSFSSTRQQLAGVESVSNSYIPFVDSLQDLPKPQYGSQEWAKGVVEGAIPLRNEKRESAQHTDAAKAREVQVVAAATVSSGEVSSKVLSRKLRKERRQRKPAEEQHRSGKPATFARVGMIESTQSGRSDGTAPNAERKPTIRVIGEKKKVYDSGFKIHYSAPIATVSAQPSKPDTTPKSKPSNIMKDNNKKKDNNDWEPPEREHWQIDKEALKAKFPTGWKPMKRLSPDALAGIRALHAQDPAQYTTAILANSFQVSPEAMRRILKSKWSPNAEEESDRSRRWENRGKSVYSRFVELGTLTKPPKKWRDMGIGKGKPERLLKKQEDTRKRTERGEQQLPALIKQGRVRDEKYGLRHKTQKGEKLILPALVTTRRVWPPVIGVEEALEDRIL